VPVKTFDIENDAGVAPSVLSGGGEMGALMRAIDWSKTAVGPVDGWPQSLCTALSILLDTGFPMYIAWGPDFTQFYNDGYRPILGSTKHPAAMGTSTRETFAEIWDIIGPMFEGVMAGTPVFVKDFHLPLDRHGFTEECYFVFSYSPIREETRRVGGVLVTVTETTDRVLGARRLVTLQDLVAKTHHSATPRHAAETACSVLSQNAADIPFALLYLFDDDGKRAVLGGAVRVAPSSSLSLSSIDLTVTALPWPLSALRTMSEAQVIAIPPGSEALGGAGTKAPTKLYAVPIFASGADSPSGILLSALSPYLLCDANYKSFLELVAGHIGAAIANARALEEAKARAEALAELDRAKTVFFSNVSHEFRTPLTLMLAPLDDMRNLPRDAPVDPVAVELVHRNALRLLKLVNTLLAFSRIEAGRQEATYDAIDLSAFTAELASSFRAAIERAGLSFVVDCLPSAEPIYVDRDMWEKIVLNLLSNAFKFTFTGSITVHFQLVDGQAQLDVTDTGTGIAEEEVPRLFERFHRIQGVRSRSHEGSGIGLALVQELVRLHGGNVTVTSTLGGGTNFCVRIPRGSAHLPAARVGGARSLSSTTGGAEAYVQEALRWSAPPGTNDDLVRLDRELGKRKSDRRERIVVADDNADMRDYVSRLLRERWEVEAVADGAAALASLQKEPAALVLTDVMMPIMDGFSLVRAMRSDARLRAVPAIFLSARAGEEDAATGLAVGANDYIAKPFSARELLVRVASCLATARVSREVSEIEAAQRAALYRHFMQAPFPIAVFRGARHLVELANPQTLAAWGKDAEIIGLPLEEAVPELRDQPFLGYLDQVFRSGETYEGREELAVLPTGPGGKLQEIYCNFVYAPLRDGTGAIEGILLSAFVVTEQVLARQELERVLSRAEESGERAAKLALELSATTQRLHAAQRAARVGTFDWDVVNAKLTWSPEIYSLMGIAVGSLEATADAWIEALLEEDREASLLAFRDATAALNPTMEVEVRLRQPEGGGRWVRVSTQLNYGNDGSVRHALGAVVDIQSLKEAAAERSRALAELERANRAKDEFLATMSHELRTPLNAIVGWSNLLRTGAVESSQVPKALETIERNARIQSRLIEDMLDLARIEQGKLVLSVGPTEIIRVVEAAIDAVRPAADAKGVRLQPVLDSHATVIGDADRLQQVAWNLLSNAIKFTPRGGRVQIRVRREPSYVELVVADDGQGIAGDFLPYVFDRFRQADGKISRKAGGLGLGLAIVRAIVQLHGGTVNAQSDGVGAGATFSVRIPMAPLRTSSAGSGSDRDTPAAAPTFECPPALSGLHVLVVDDEPETRDLLRYVLEQCNTRVSEAAGATEALSQLSLGGIDLLVSDIGMPEIDGYEFIRRVRTLGDEGARIPAIALTAYARTEDRTQALRAGFDMHLTKPVEPSELLVVIGTLIEGVRRRVR